MGGARGVQDADHLELDVVLPDQVDESVSAAEQDRHQVDADLASLRQEHDQLEAKAAALKSPNAIAAEARRLGLVMEGERSFVVKHLPH